MPLTPDQLPDDIAELKQRLIASAAELTAKTAELEAAKNGLVVTQLTIEKLKAQIAKLRREKFGASSERIERVIAQLELALEEAVRSWATLDPLARSAVQAIDRRRLSYVEGMLRASGLSSDVARARAQILYWAFIGFALSEKPLPRARQQAVLDELLQFASR